MTDLVSKLTEKPSALHILLGVYYKDSRVINEVTSLSKTVDVSVVCWSSEEGADKRALHNGPAAIIEYPRGQAAFGYMFFLVKTLLCSFKIKPQIVHGHDLTSLPIAYLAHKLTGAKLIYDSHELWSQAHHNKRRAITMLAAQWMERFVAHRADAVVTVSDSIAHYLSDYFNNRNLFVIRNIPLRNKIVHNQSLERNEVRDKLGLKHDDFVVLYQGMIRRERGVFLLADAMATLCNASPNTQNIKLLYLGDGADKDELEAYVKAKGLDDICILKSAVSQRVLASFTASADIGVHAISNSCLNHDFCLPNKLFEYISSGLPVIVSNLTEMTKFVTDNGVGITFEDDNANDLAEKITALQQKGRYDEIVQAITDKSDSFSSEEEYDKLNGLYQKML